MTDIHDTADLVSKALRRAWQLGQTYWQQADSEYQSHWKKADATQNEFDRLEEDTRAAILTANSIAQPAPSVPNGWLQHSARMATLARKLREPDWCLESIREMQRELCALEEAALDAAQGEST